MQNKSAVDFGRMMEIQVPSNVTATWLSRLTKAYKGALGWDDHRRRFVIAHIATGFVRRIAAGLPAISTDLRKACQRATYGEVYEVARQIKSATLSATMADENSLPLEAADTVMLECLRVIDAAYMGDKMYDPLSVLHRAPFDTFALGMDSAGRIVQQAVLASGDAGGKAKIRVFERGAKVLLAAAAASRDCS